MLDWSWEVRAYKPCAAESDGVSGPRVAPGRYRVVLEAAGKRAEADLDVAKDPRVKMPQKAFDQQLALLKRLHDQLGALHLGVNRLRSLKRQLADLIARLNVAPHQALRDQALALSSRLEAVEGALVDIHRVSPRDVLRNPAGLNDTLADLISVVAIADEAPTTQARQVSDEIVAKVDAQLAQLDGLLANDLAQLNAALLTANVNVLGIAAA